MKSYKKNQSGYGALVIFVGIVLITSALLLALAYYRNGNKDDDNDSQSSTTSEGLSIEGGGLPENDIASSEISSGSYNYEKFGLGFEVPSGWKGAVYQTANGFEVINIYSQDYSEGENKLESPAAGARFSVSCSSVVSETPRVNDLLSGNRVDSETYQQVEEVEIDRKKAAKLIYNGNANPDRAVYLESGNNICMISHVNTNSRDYDKYSEAFNNFVNSLKISG